MRTAADKRGGVGGELEQHEASRLHPDLLGGALPTSWWRNYYSTANLDDDELKRKQREESGGAGTKYVIASF